MSTGIYEEPIAPTVEAIDAWLAQTEKHKPEGAIFATEYDHYGVNVWTKAGSCRCIAGHSGGHGMGIYNGVDSPGYWTIRGEGSSNGGRDTWVWAHKIVRAVAVIIGERDARFQS